MPTQFLSNNSSIMKNRLIVSCRLPGFMISTHWQHFTALRRMHSSQFTSYALFLPHMEKYARTNDPCRSKLKAGHACTASVLLVVSHKDQCLRRVFFFSLNVEQMIINAAVVCGFKMLMLALFPDRPENMNFFFSLFS